MSIGEHSREKVNDLANDLIMTAIMCIYTQYMAIMPANCLSFIFPVTVPLLTLLVSSWNCVIMMQQKSPNSLSIVWFHRIHSFYSVLKMACYWESVCTLDLIRCTNTVNCIQVAEDKHLSVIVWMLGEVKQLFLW